MPVRTRQGISPGSGASETTTAGRLARASARKALLDGVTKKIAPGPTSLESLVIPVISCPSGKAAHNSGHRKAGQKLGGLHQFSVLPRIMHSCSPFSLSKGLGDWSVTYPLPYTLILAVWTDSL